jgi:sugar phosphate isomerase/epimerase
VRLPGSWEQSFSTEGGQPKDHVEAMAGCLKRCLPFVEREEIVLVVDNPVLVTNDADLQVDEVNSPYVQATMDAVNYRWAGHDLDTVGRFYSVPRCGRQIVPFGELQVFVKQSLESLMDL